MRFREFNPQLNEDPSLPALKKDIVSQVKKTTEFNVLDRVYQVLSQSGNKDKIEKAFGKNLKSANIGSVESVIDDMMHQIGSLAGTSKQKEDFVVALEKGKAVNEKALLAKTSTFSDIFVSSFAEDFFMSIANYGRGSNMKGPGEFALAIMSPKIALADKGDLIVSGKHIEVKSALNKSGGRLGEVGANKETILPVLLRVCKKHAKAAPDKKELKAFLEYFVDHSMALSKAVSRLHDVFDGDKKAIKEIVSSVVELTFDKKIGNAVGAAASKDASGVMAEQAYMEQNFNWYKKRDGFDEILAIWFGGRKTFSFETGAELLSLRASGAFGAASVSFVPSKPNEVFAQINFTKGGAAASGPATGAAKSSAMSKVKQKAKPSGRVSAAAGGRAKPKTGGTRGKR